MSKSSPKQKYIQLQEWLSTRKTKSNNRRANTGGKFSKADVYKNSNRGVH